MTWFVIAGRFAGDTKETVLILQAPSKDYAIVAFEADLMRRIRTTARRSSSAP